MRRKEREVTDEKIIEAMLMMMDTMHIAMNDEEGYPYSVPVNYGFEWKEGNLMLYFHCAKEGHKVDLMKKDPKVCVSISAFSDFPDSPVKGHKHDYRSVIAKGKVKLLDGTEDYETYKTGHTLIHTCNNRPEHALSPDHLPPMYIGVITCPREMVTAKSEVPLNSAADVPFKAERHNVPRDIHKADEG